jgi:dolichol-phosphate mannosyltransferase
LDYFKQSNIDVLECVRTQRRDPWFRKLITAALRLLVLVKSGKYPKDANTPVRLYTKSILSEIVRLIPENILTPNLFISIHLRKTKTKYAHFRIITRDRLGENRVGTTWNTRRSLMPSKKLLQFCAIAIKQIYKI